MRGEDVEELRKNEFEHKRIKELLYMLVKIHKAEQIARSPDRLMLSVDQTTQVTA